MLIKIYKSKIISTMKKLILLLSLLLATCNFSFADDYDDNSEDSEEVIIDFHKKDNLGNNTGGDRIPVFYPNIKITFNWH